MNILHALESFLVQLRADGRSAHTIAQYRRHVRAFSDWLAQGGHPREVEAIGHEHLAAFLAAPETRTTRRPVTMNALRTSLRMMFRFLHESGAIPHNPARLIRRALCSSPPPSAVSPADLELLLGTVAAVGTHEARRDHALWMFLSGSGARIGSAIAMDVTDVDIASRTVTLRRMKGDRPAVLFLPTAVRDELERFIGARTDGALFTDRHGRRITTRHAQRRFQKWVALAGIKAPTRPHALRHAFALRVLEKTHDLRLVQAALCHASPASTAVYTTVPEARLRAAVEA